MPALLRTGADVSRAMKKELKTRWPGVKWSVTQRSGGSSITARWTNGPTEKDVKAVIGKYELGHFDGMDDSYHYNQDRPIYTDASGNVGELGGVRYVFCNRSYALAGAPGQDVCAALAGDLGAVMGWDYGGDVDAHAPWANGDQYRSWRMEVARVLQVSTLADGLHGIRARADRQTNHLTGIESLAEAY